jgi:hypothetical protein
MPKHHLYIIPKGDAGYEFHPPDVVIIKPGQKLKVRNMSGTEISFNAPDLFPKNGDSIVAGHKKEFPTNSEAPAFNTVVYKPVGAKKRPKNGSGPSIIIEA